MRLINDHEVPMDLLQARQDRIPLRQVQRGDDLPMLQPLVDTELLANGVALQNDELLVEFFAQLALPLKRQIGGAYDQGAQTQAAQFQLPQQQTGHDRLTRAGIVGKQKADARQLEKVVVNRFELVRQRIDAGNRQTEVRIELVGNTERVRLKADAYELAIAGIRACRPRYLEALELGPA